MRKIKFQTGVIYEFDLSDAIRFGPIRKQKLWDKFTDGRIAGLLGQAFVESMYNNFSPAPSENSSYDLIDDNGNHYEVRTFTRNGASLIPSAQRGTGRTFNEKEYLAKRNNIHAYIFIDIRNSPKFSIIGILESDLPHCPTTIRERRFKNLIAKCPNIKVSIPKA